MSLEEISLCLYLYGIAMCTEMLSPFEILYVSSSFSDSVLRLIGKCGLSKSVTIIVYRPIA